MPAVYCERRVGETPYPDNSLCGDHTLDSSPDFGTSFVNDNSVCSSTSTNSQPTNCNTNNIASPIMADSVDHSIDSINNVSIGTDDEDELICLSPDVDFMVHSPQVNQQLIVKIDPISAYFNFETKVQSIILK